MKKEKLIHKVDYPNFTYRQSIIKCEQLIIIQDNGFKFKTSKTFTKVTCKQCLNLKNTLGYN